MLGSAMTTGRSSRSSRFADFFPILMSNPDVDTDTQALTSISLLRPPTSANLSTYASPTAVTSATICPSSTAADCKIIRASKCTMATFRNLSSSGTIVLFTPVITPAGSGKASNKNAESVDPFEILGRALSRHHRRIRHVPYVPRVGFTETHDAFLSQADAVVVVICEPESQKHEGLGCQVDFAEAAHDGLESNHFGRSASNPMILIQCGDPNGNFWPDLSTFDSVMKCRAYDTEMAQQIARKIFDGRK